MEALRTVGPSGGRPAMIADQVVRIARLDAEQVYRDDLSDYRITPALEPDGWHVDYHLTDLRLHGGGPHYVIDAVTGSIVAKRYEQ